MSNRTSGLYKASSNRPSFRATNLASRLSKFNSKVSGYFGDLVLWVSGSIMKICQPHPTKESKKERVWTYGEEEIKEN